MMPTKKSKWFLENYDEKYKEKAILEVMYKDPDEIETIIGNKNLSIEEKSQGLLERGLPSKHVSLILDMVKETVEPWSTDKINQIMQETMLLISRGEWVEAEKNLVEILQQNTKYSIAHFGMGICSDMQGEKNIAAEWFKRAYILDPISFNQARFMIGLK